MRYKRSLGWVATVEWWEADSWCTLKEQPTGFPVFCLFVSFPMWVVTAGLWTAQSSLARGGLGEKNPTWVHSPSSLSYATAGGLHPTAGATGLGHVKWEVPVRCLSCITDRTVAVVYLSHTFLERWLPCIYWVSNVPRVVLALTQFIWSSQWPFRKELLATLCRWHWSSEACSNLSKITQPRCGE